MTDEVQPIDIDLVNGELIDLFDELKQDPKASKLNESGLDRAGLGLYDNNDEHTYVLYSRPHSLKAMILLHDEIRPLACENPADWLFFTNDEPDKGRIEIKYATALANKLDIPITCPFVTIGKPELRDECVNQGMDKDDFYHTIFDGALMLGKRDQHKDEHIYEVQIQLCLEWGEEPKELAERLLEQTQSIMADPVKKANAPAELDKRLDSIIRVQQELSKAKIEKVKADNPERNNILAHLDFDKR